MNTVFIFWEGLEDINSSRIFRVKNSQRRTFEETLKLPWASLSPLPTHKLLALAGLKKGPDKNAAGKYIPYSLYHSKGGLCNMNSVWLYFTCNVCTCIVSYLYATFCVPYKFDIVFVHVVLHWIESKVRSTVVGANLSDDAKHIVFVIVLCFICHVQCIC